MADWADRTRFSIKLTSPTGVEYEARWSGNTISMANKTAIHEFPGVAGAKVQDLGMGPRMYNLTLFFNDQQNADLESQNFINAFYKDIGNWTITHPTKGDIDLIKISATETIDPTTSGGLYIVETEWVEQIEESEATTAAQIQTDVVEQAKVANSSSQDQFVSNAKQDTAGQTQNIITTIGKAITSVKTKLALIEGSLVLDPKITSISLAIENTLEGGSDGLIDTSALSSQIQQLVQIYGFGQTTSTAAVQMYSDFMDDVLLATPIAADEDGLSTIATLEIVATAAMIASCQMAIIGNISTRQQVITTIKLLQDQFDTLTQTLDGIQTLYNTQPIDLAYFSQSNSFADILLATSQAIQFLIRSLYGLPSERRVIIKEKTATVQVAKDQYGQINNEESDIYYLQQLIDSNELLGDMIYIIPAGTQLLIYQ